MSLSDMRSQNRQFLSPRYTADMEESQAAAPEDLASIYVLASDLEGEAYGHMADLT